MSETPTMPLVTKRALRDDDQDGHLPIGRWHVAYLAALNRRDGGSSSLIPCHQARPCVSLKSIVYILKAQDSEDNVVPFRRPIQAHVSTLRTFQVMLLATQSCPPAVRHFTSI